MGCAAHHAMLAWHAGEEGNKSVKKTGQLLYYYWHRIAGTSLSWFVWDFAFYGNKVRSEL